MDRFPPRIQTLIRYYQLRISNDKREYQLSHCQNYPTCRSIYAKPYNNGVIFAYFDNKWATSIEDMPKFFGICNKCHQYTFQWYYDLFNLK